MTPDEVKVLRFMLRVEKPVSSHRIAGQFHTHLALVDLIMAALKRELLVEQDGKFFRPTKGAQQVLDDFENRFKHVPFAGRPAW